MIPQTLPRFGPAFASLAPWRETLFWRSLVAPGFLRLTAKAQRTQREIAKQAKRQCHSCLAIAICSTGVLRFETLGFENAPLLTM